MQKSLFAIRRCSHVGILACLYKIFNRRKLIIQIMRITIFLTLACVVNVYAKSYSQEKLTLDLKNVRLTQLFDIIEYKTDYQFLYNDEDVDKAPFVNLSVEDATVPQIMAACFTKNYPLTYRIENKTIVVLPEIEVPKKIAIPNKSKTFQFTVIGKVMDSTSGNPLVGVTVKVKGSTEGAITDENGKFSLEVPDSAVLEISYVGYNRKEISIRGRTSINILLTTAAAGLNQLVVIGYGRQKKSTLTGAVSAVNGDAVVRPGAANISQTMAGKISGLSIEPQSGEPGVNPVIHIRGIGTTGSSAPLVVVDGIIRDNLTDIDPSIIESVSVLKDAAAVAPYGLGGANGVLLITTRTGKIGNPILTVDAYRGNQKATWLPNPLNAVDYMKLQNEATTNVSSSSTPPYTTDFINNYNANHSSDPDKYPDARASDLLNKLIPVQNYNIKVSGGSKNVTYFIGGGYFKQDGLFDKTNFDRYNFNVNVDSKVTESTKINVNIINSFDRKNELSPFYSSSSMLRWIYFVKPTAPLYFTNGKWGDSNNSSLVGGLRSGSYNRDNGTSLLNTFTVDQQLPFVKGLSVKGAFSYDLNSSFIKGFSRPAYYWIQDVSTTPYTYTKQVSNMEQNSPPNPALNETYSKKQTYTYQAFLNYQRTFGSHEISFLGVAELRKSNYKILTTTMKNFSLDIDEFNLGSSNTSDYSITGTSDEAIQVGYVYRAGYIYENKYMVEASGRYDGHYYFAPGKRFGFFPAFSFGWMLSEEKFMKSFTFVDNLKIRGSWGKSGNLAGSAYQYLAGYRFLPNQYVFGSNAVPGAYPNSEANPNITWEVSNKSDIGVEVSLWRSLLTIEADYFFEKRNGMLLPPAISVPFEYGIGLSDENKGVMNNHGIELAIGGIYRFQNGLKLDFNGNFSFAKNKMKKVFETAATYDNPNRRRTGRPINTPFGYHALGLFSTEDDKNGDGIINTADGYDVVQFTELHPGDIQYEDVNKDGKIDANDEVAVGYSTYPEVTYGFAPAIEWRGFDLTLFWQGVALNSMNVNNRFQTVSLFNTQSNTDYEYYNNHWTPEHQNARYPRAYVGPNSNNNAPPSDFWYERGDYLRLKSCMIGYTIPRNVLEKISMRSLRVYFSGTNLFTLTKVKFFDPEAIDGGSGAGLYPAMKQFIFGASLTF